MFLPTRVMAVVTAKHFAAKEKPSWQRLQSTDNNITAHAGPPAGVDQSQSSTNQMKRAKGVTLAEIVAATGWQRHTVRGFVSIRGEQGRAENRILEERGWGTLLQNREVAGPRQIARSRIGPDLSGQ
jgi:hypothetical protein